MSHAGSVITCALVQTYLETLLSHLVAKPAAHTASLSISHKDIVFIFDPQGTQTKYFLAINLLTFSVYAFLVLHFFPLHLSSFPLNCAIFSLTLIPSLFSTLTHTVSLSIHTLSLF